MAIPGVAKQEKIRQAFGPPIDLPPAPTMPHQMDLGGGASEDDILSEVMTSLPVGGNVKIPKEIHDILREAWHANGEQGLVSAVESLIKDYVPEVHHALGQYVSDSEPSPLLNLPPKALAYARAITSQARKILTDSPKVQGSRVLKRENQERRGLSYTSNPVSFLYPAEAPNKYSELITEKFPARELLGSYDTLPSIYSIYPTEQEFTRLTPEMLAAIRRFPKQGLPKP